MLGPLAGIATGPSVGILAALMRSVLSRLPTPLAAVAIGVTAMALTDRPRAKLGLTDPKDWSAPTGSVISSRICLWHRYIRHAEVAQSSVTGGRPGFPDIQSGKILIRNGIGSCQ